ncbi:MAG TPA: hypothetical protein VGA82_04815, partial [Dehalococcoidales bacterium]
MWVWVVVALASLTVLLISILCVPVDAVLTLDTSAERKFRFRLVWLFGLISPELGRERRKPRQPGRPKRKRRVGLRTIWRILRTRGLLTKIKNLVRDVLSRIKIKEIAVDLRLGLDDPADTGLVFAV